MQGLSDLSEVEVCWDLLRKGDRRALARAITLVESHRQEDRLLADWLMDKVDLSLTEAEERGSWGWTMALTGPPGVGKSTLIDAFGMQVLGRGHRLAVLAVDPSSSRSGGSILGDKTRMQRLAQEEAAFIRPTPAGTMLGGTARATREAMLLCRAAGFDWILVETVGVGQSETAVADLVDWIVLLLLGRSGDDLQGIKRGIVETADMLVVHKADGSGKEAALETLSYYRTALHLFPPHSLPGWQVPCMALSSVEEGGLEALWKQLDVLHKNPELPGWVRRRRQEQKVLHYRRKLETALSQHWLQSGRTISREAVENMVRQGSLSPVRAVDYTLQEWGIKPAGDPAQAITPQRD